MYNAVRTIRYRVVSRVFNKNALVGYELVDIESGYKKVVKLTTAQELASKGEIKDCKVSGRGLSGKNGFELKLLPKINI